MKKKIFISAIAVIVVVISVFTACAGDKETTTTTKSNTTLNNEQVSLVRDENGEIVTGEDGKAMTTVVSGDTTKSNNVTTTKQTTTKKVTTTKKTTTTTKKQSYDLDIDIEFNEPTTKKTTTTTKKAETTKNIAKPLTASQKQWVLDNWFNKFPEQGAADGFHLYEQDDENGLIDAVGLTQGNYKSMVELLSDDMGLSKGCTVVFYYWEDTSTESILHFHCVKN